jgi:hypothetical protein
MNYLHKILHLQKIFRAMRILYAHYFTPLKMKIKMIPLDKKNDGYMTVTRRLHGGYMTVTRRLHGGYMAVTRRLHGGYMAVKWRLNGGYGEGQELCRPPPLAF